MTDRIEKVIELKAPVDRVWRALTDHREFGAWFRVDLDEPFAPGQVSRGHMTWPGYEHLLWEATVVTMEPQRRFVFTWHPYAVDPAVDYSAEPPTLVEFTLKPAGDRTHLTVTESGFDAIPAYRRDEALRMNTGGWETQLKNIQVYVGASAQPVPRDPAPVFAALGDRTRLSLLKQLSDGGARSIAALSADSRLTRQAVTKHLHVLREAGLVRSLRVGRESRFAYQPEPVDEARAYLDAVSAQWDGALERLRAFVED